MSTDASWTIDSAEHYPLPDKVSIVCGQAATMSNAHHGHDPLQRSSDPLVQRRRTRLTEQLPGLERELDNLFGDLEDDGATALVCADADGVVLFLRVGEEVIDDVFGLGLWVGMNWHKQLGALPRGTICHVAPVFAGDKRHAATVAILGRAPGTQRGASGPQGATAPQAREEPLVMALLVWFTMGIALWHFTVFLPDRFWQGIVGAFLGSVIGAVVFGAIVEVASGRGLGTTDVATALTAIPGVAIGLVVVWAIGVRSEQAA